jgi:hypothetical protein
VASFTFAARVAAPIEVTFDVLTDHRGYASITPIRSVTLEREGAPPPNGTGAIRVLKSIGPPIREQITTFERPTRFAYRLLSGAPVRDYTGEVELTADGDGTRIVYHVKTTPTIPIVGGLVVAVARRAVHQLFNGIVKEAERRARLAP